MMKSTLTEPLLISLEILRAETRHALPFGIDEIVLSRCLHPSCMRLNSNQSIEALRQQRADSCLQDAGLRHLGTDGTCRVRGGGVASPLSVRLSFSKSA